MGYLIIIALGVLVVPILIAIAMAGWRRGGPHAYRKPPMRPEPVEEGAEAPEAGREKKVGRPGTQNDPTQHNHEQSRT